MDDTTRVREELKKQPLGRLPDGSGVVLDVLDVEGSIAALDGVDVEHLERIERSLRGVFLNVLMLGREVMRRIDAAKAAERLQAPETGGH